MKKKKNIETIPGSNALLEKEFAREILYAGMEEAARACRSELEIFYEMRALDHFRFEHRDLKEGLHKESEGWGLRLLKDGRMGIAATTKSGSLMESLLLAQEMAPHGPTVAGSFLAPSGRYPEVQTFDHTVSSLDMDDLIAMGQEIIDRVLRRIPDVTLKTDVYRVFELKSIRNNLALNGRYLQSLVAIFVSAKKVQEGDILSCSESCYSCRWDPDHIKEVADQVVEKIESARTITPMETGTFPVIFTGSALGTVILPLVAAMNGKAFLEGISVLQNKLETEVFSPSLTLVDDSTGNYLPGSSPFDDEGTPSQRTVMVKKGVPQSVLCDLETAARLKRVPTGNGYRRSRSGGTSFAVQPATGISNLNVTPGRTGIEAMIAMVDDGLLVNQVMGAGRGDIQNGDYSVNVYLGYRIKNGKIIGRVKNTMVSGNILQDLSRVLVVGDNPFQVRSNMFCPALLVDGVSVSA